MPVFHFVYLRLQLLTWLSLLTNLGFVWPAGAALPGRDGQCGVRGAGAAGAHLHGLLALAPHPHQGLLPGAGGALVGTIGFNGVLGLSRPCT